MLSFSKMQGIGNDYVYIDCIHQQVENPSALSVRLSDRHFGVGGDGIILICPSDKADFRMRMFNADGSEGKMCGNGIRCFSRFVYEKGLTDKTELTVETLSGIKHCTLMLENNKVSRVRVDMGVPEFTSSRVPVLSELDEMINAPVDIGGVRYDVTCVSMGNPHCVVFTDCPVDDIELSKIGPMFEKNPMFPEQVNTEFVNRLADGSLKMRVWERGSGETWACGTGACAVLAAAVRNSVINGREATVHLRGGDLSISWDSDLTGVFMTGGAEFVFEGEVEV